MTAAPADTIRAETAPGAALAIPEDVETPSLVVDLARVRVNLEDMATFADSVGVALYPHVKTHRTVEFARMQVDAGAAGLCVAKLSEAEVFVDAGFTDLVMAYPIAGEDKHRRAMRLGERAKLRLSVDSLEGARAFSGSLVKSGAAADVLLEVDTGFLRSGADPEMAPGMAREIAGLPGIRFRGIITHEGQAAGGENRAAIETAAVAAGEIMVRVAAEIRAMSIDVDTVSVGSTSTAKATTTVSGITELRPGIYAFNDYGQVIAGTVGVDRCAARVVATVVSHAAPDRAIVDAGSKSLGQDLLGIWFRDAAPGHGLVIGHPGWRLISVSEEHGWLRWDRDGPPTPLDVGVRVQILPNHICSAFHVLGESVIIDEGEHVDTWVATARGCSK